MPVEQVDTNPPDSKAHQRQTGYSYTAAMKKRYSDAYLVTKFTVGVGAIIKVLALVVATVFALLSLVIASSFHSAFLFLPGIFMGALIGGVIYILGILVTASGQNLQASLDTAVNTSPHATDEEKAEMMSLARMSFEKSSGLNEQGR